MLRRACSRIVLCVFAAVECFGARSLKPQELKEGMVIGTNVIYGALHSASVLTERRLRFGAYLGLIVLASVLLWSANFAAAEPYAGLFVGAAIPQDSDVESGVFQKETFKDVELDASALFGAKAGFFLDATVLGGNFGLESEVYHFRPDIDTQTVNFSTGGFGGKTTFIGADVHVTAVGLNGLYRLPLGRSPDFPQGRFHPYAGVGLGAFIASLKTRTTVLDANTTFGDTDVKPGFQAVAGTRFFLTRHIALFTEYKFVHTADFKFNLVSDPGTSLGVPTGQVNKLELNLTTHMLEAGIAYHW
jgi:opacity protein-like surface antigen